MAYDRCVWCDEEFEQDECCIELNGLYHQDCFNEAAPSILFDLYGAEETFFHKYDEWDKADFERKNAEEEAISGSIDHWYDGLI